MTVRVDIATESFDPGVLLHDLEGLGGGAVASFIGVVRGEAGVARLDLEHHPVLTRTIVERLAAAALARFDLAGVTVVHRVGPLAAGERIVFVGAAARHRGAALAAVSMLIDRLKTDAPFWKKEHRRDGSAAWVAPRAADADAADRWRAEG